MTDKSRDPEVALRAVLSSRAAQAPDAGPVADRIRRARVSADARRRERRTFRGVLDLWAKPLITALVVAALGAGAYGITRAGGGSANSASTSSGAGGAAMKAPAQQSVAAGAASVGGTSAAATATASDVPNGFTATDLTFVSTHEGWAVGSAPCSAGYCVVVLRTTDGGRQWTAVGVPKLTSGTRNIAAAQHVRFADPEHGYLFGSRVYATNDGGVHWTQQTGLGNGGHITDYRLEVADGVAVAVAYDPTGGPSAAYRSSVGSITWSDVGPLGHTFGSLPVSRVGAVMAALFVQNTVGSGSSATSDLWMTTDGGVHWVDRQEVCPQTGGHEWDSHSVSVGTDRTVSVLCVQRYPAGAAPVVLTSTDGGTTFASAATPASDCSQIVAASGADVYCVGTDGVFRVYREPCAGSGTNCVRPSSSGESTTTAIADPGLASGALPAFFGFETASTGRYLSTDGRTVWTTTDAGVHWKAAGFR